MVRNKRGAKAEDESALQERKSHADRNVPCSFLDHAHSRGAVPLSRALSAGDQEIQKAGKAVRLVWFPRFSPDGKWLITAHGSWDENEGGEVRVWEAETGKPRFVVPTERGVRTVAWAPNGKSFVSGDYGGSIFFYDAETGKQTDQIKLPGNVEVLQSSPDGKRLFAAVGDGSVRAWEVPSKNQVYTWKMLHRGGIWGMALSPDGKMLATAGQDHFVAPPGHRGFQSAARIRTSRGRQRRRILK